MVAGCHTKHLKFGVSLLALIDLALREAHCLVMVLEVRLQDTSRIQVVMCRHFLITLKSSKPLRSDGLSPCLPQIEILVRVLVRHSLVTVEQVWILVLAILKLGEGVDVTLGDHFALREAGILAIGRL